MSKKANGSSKNKAAEADKIGNRFVFNFIYTIIAYILLFIFLKFSTVLLKSPITTVKIGRNVLIGVCIIFAITTIVLYVLAHTCKNVEIRPTLKNHAHMMLGFTAGSFLINFPTYYRLLITPIFPKESASGMLRSILYFFTTTQNNYYLVAVLIAVTFIILCIYNYIEYKKLSK